MPVSYTHLDVYKRQNVDRSRSEQNITFCNDDLKQVYHELFDEALAAYNLSLIHI